VLSDGLFVSYGRFFFTSWFFSPRGDPSAWTPSRAFFQLLFELLKAQLDILEWLALETVWQRQFRG